MADHTAIFYLDMNESQLRLFLEKKVEEYNNPGFISSDPVCIPHSFQKKQDREIAGLFAAVFAWGNRTLIIKKSRELMNGMDNAPHEFILHHSPNELKRLLDFKHRTFNTTDLLYFIEFLKNHYSQSESLESAFSQWMKKDDETIHHALAGFHQYFFSLEDAPARTRKHISTPLRNSTCKRLNMFLRWMVRSDDKGVDFGLWRSIQPAQLVCPMDVHVARVARKLGLLNRKQTDWLAVIELTQKLKSFDPLDPAKYDFALFSLGIIEKY